MKRTRKWAFVAQEATRLAGLGLSPSDIAKRLGVNKSSVTRWMQAGKLPRTRDDGETAPVTARPRQTPAEWADAVRQAYDLDVTDDQLVSLGEEALALSRDPKVAAHVRMSAAGRFQAIVRQLALVARGAQAAADTKPEDVAPDVPKKNPIVNRPANADPRGLLMAVK